MTDAQDWNRAVIDGFRSTGRADRFGTNLVILHTTGARSGQHRENPVAAVPDDDGSWLVAASYAGRDENPAWYHNLMAHPELTIETSEVRDGTGIAVRAVQLEGEERDAAYRRFHDLAESFREYETKTTRVIPVIRLVPIDQD